MLIIAALDSWPRIYQGSRLESLAGFSRHKKATNREPLGCADESAYRAPSRSPRLNPIAFAQESG